MKKTVFLMLALIAFSLIAVGCIQEKKWEATPTPSPIIASPTPSPSPSPLASPSPSPTPSPAASPSPSPSPSPVASVAPSCTITANPNLFTGPKEDVVLSAIFSNLPAGITQATLKCSQTDSGTSAEISNVTHTAFRTCSYPSVTVQTAYTISASAGGASCTNTVTVNMNATAPPTFSNIASSVTQNTSLITWTTDKNSDSKVEYGTSESYGTNKTNETETLVTSHHVLLTNLNPNTLYHYRVWSCSTASICGVSSDKTFTTSPLPTPTPSPSPSPTYSFYVTPTTESFEINKSVSNTTTRNYVLTNNGTAALGQFNCSSDKTWVTHQSGCPASLAVNATATVTFLYNATDQSNGVQTVTLTFSEANAGSKTSVATVNVTS